MFQLFLLTDEEIFSRNHFMVFFCCDLLWISQVMSAWTLYFYSTESFHFCMIWSVAVSKLLPAPGSNRFCFRWSGCLRFWKAGRCDSGNLDDARFLLFFNGRHWCRCPVLFHNLRQKVRPTCQDRLDVFAAGFFRPWMLKTCIIGSAATDSLGRCACALSSVIGAMLIL